MLGALWYNCGLNGCPNVQRLTSYQPGGATVLFDAAGERFADLSPVEHEVVELSALPKHVPGAFIAVEDHRFYDHHGIDFRRVGGALVANAKAMRFKEGFSTISMQLARNVFPERLPGEKRTLRRKALEVRVARDIERAYDKNEILELYLNHIYFGGGAYGIEAASRNYFDKAAKDLTAAEAAMLAALPKSPTLYNPRRYRERAQERRDLVLRLMVRHGHLTAAEQAQAVATQMTVRREPALRRTVGVAPYFVEAARRVLEDRFGEDLYTAPLHVHTTLDRRAQHVAEQQLERQLAAIEAGKLGSYEGVHYDATAVTADGSEYIQGAVVLLDARNGDVRALVGGRDFMHSRFDRATQARRYAGSAFEPFVFAAAMAEGYAPSQLVADDSSGYISIRDALVQSRSVPVTRIATDVGFGDIARIARRAGIRSELRAEPALAEGTAPVTPLEITAAYTPLARFGTAIRPRMIVRVADGTGAVLWEPDAEEHEVMDSAAAYLVTHMLQDAATRGSAVPVRHAGYAGTMAGKTGMTDQGTDVWFVGYTPEYVGTVWIGFDRPRAIMTDSTSSTLAAPVWAHMMNALGEKAEAWPVPSDIVERRIDPASGAVLADGCTPKTGKPRTELFIVGKEPVRVCPSGTPVAAKTTPLRRVGNVFGRTASRVGRWLTRHFGSEEPQLPPPDENHLGAPRLPKARDVTG
jgi:membrane peptidoglycan carboxypeptidase